MVKVLLIEDYANIRDVYAIGLTEAGFETDTADSGAEGLVKCTHTTYDVICLDMVMLQYSGMEFLEAFRAHLPAVKTKIIVLSNIDSPKIIERAKALGVEKYLIKSHYTPRQLAEEVKRVLGMAAPA